MSVRYLFSPIGGTDPISNFRDGSFLHICRVYRPDVVYLFMSKEIYQYHEKDNRYIYCLEKLGELLGHEFRYELIVEAELSEVQDYNYFYRRFRDIISGIYVGMGSGDIMYVNTSSGTPAMKSALQVMASVTEYHFVPVQVKTPERRMNPHNEDRVNYETEEYWELNLDNDADSFENRCEEVECENLMLLLKLDMIRKFIASYDYAAAMLVADEIKDEISEAAYGLICAAAARLQLDKSGVAKGLKGTGLQIIPVQSGNQRDIVEYMLMLQIKLFKGELADFMRGITPVMVDLFEMILEKQCGVTVDDYCYFVNSENGPRRWDFAKLQADGKLWNILSNDYRDGFKGDIVYSDHIVRLIENLSRDAEMIRMVSNLRSAEMAVRNAAAHEIVSVTDAWIKVRTRRDGGFSSSDIFKMMKKLCSYAGLPGGDKVWKSYGYMNELITEELNRTV